MERLSAQDETSISSPVQDPFSQRSLRVQTLLSSQDPGLGTQLDPSHAWHSGHVPALPVELGLPPQCQPALITPTPGSELNAREPSALTVPVPMATNAARSWS